MNHFIGFSSLTDFISSYLGLKYAPLHLSVVALFSVITSFVGTYIWEDPMAIYTLWTLMCLDWITGVAKAFKAGDIVSWKLFRTPVFFVTTSTLISLSFWMAKGQVAFYLLPTIVITGFYSVFLISLLENSAELGLLPETVVKIIKKKFGLSSVMKSIEKKTEVKEEPKEDSEQDSPGSV